MKGGDVLAASAATSDSGQRCWWTSYVVTSCLTLVFGRDNLVRPRTLHPGLARAAVVALAAWLLAKVVPLLGAPVLAILIGLAVSAVRRPGLREAPGIAFASSVLLQTAIVLLGTTLALGQILRV